jgi:transcriptional regulator with XRE-family HTH domain
MKNTIIAPKVLSAYFCCDLKQYPGMNIGENIKKIRSAKKLSQKEVAVSLKMDPAQYSRIEAGKSDPYFSTIEKIAKALGVEVADLVTGEDMDVNTADKSLMEKLRYIELLEEKERSAFFVMLDSLIAKKKLKDNLSNLVTG